MESQTKKKPGNDLFDIVLAAYAGAIAFVKGSGKRVLPPAKKKNHAKRLRKKKVEKASRKRNR